MPSLVDEVSREIRTISHLLHPPLLDEAGLASALRWYTEGFAKRSRIDVNLEIPPDMGRMPNDAEIAMFRVVQECLTNIHRHSESSTATIRIQRQANRVLLQVQDHGKGITQEKLEKFYPHRSHRRGLRRHAGTAKAIGRHPRNSIRGTGNSGERSAAPGRDRFQKLVRKFMLQRERPA